MPGGWGNAEGLGAGGFGGGSQDFHSKVAQTVASRPGETIAIDGPAAADDAWQLFADGQLIGSLGKFDSQGKIQRIYLSRPLMLPLPSLQNGVEGVTFAFRVWMSPINIADPYAGGLHDAPLLVAGAATAAQSRLDWLAVSLRKIDQFAYIALFLLLAVLAASLTLFDPSDRVYLWVAATLLIAPLGYILFNLCATVTWFDSRLADVLVSTDDALWAAGLVIVWRIWFRIRRPDWAPKAIALMTVAFAATDALKHGLTNYGLALPHGQHAAILNALGTTNLAIRLAFVAALALVVAKGIRSEGKEGWLALPAVVILAVEMTAEDFGVDVVGRFYGIRLQIWDVTDPLLVAVLVFLMLRRLLHSLDRQRQMAIDVSQAQEVQQVILPHALTTMPGLVIESEYRPAREVGGDFFQIIPDKIDGSLLIVAGDVTGKGLKAGMLVALLAGAIRSTAETKAAPAKVLAVLNRLLLGRGDSQATCLALRISKNGEATLANAGHLPPYLNGEPLAMDGALPLGMIEDQEFSVMHFQLNPGDKLVLMSDGIAEATDERGQLFGFERVHQLLRTATSAAQIAAAAQNYGQEDDITVLTLTFAPAGVLHA